LTDPKNKNLDFLDFFFINMKVVTKHSFSNIYLWENGESFHKNKNKNSLAWPGMIQTTIVICECSRVFSDV
jgi:hypothetical protein